MSTDLFLYYLSQDDSRGYDTYDSCIVAAETEDEARNIHPLSGWGSRTWARKPEYVKVELLGIAVPGTEPGVILASFNAG